MKEELHHDLTAKFQKIQNEFTRNVESYDSTCNIFKKIQRFESNLISKGSATSLVLPPLKNDYPSLNFSKALPVSDHQTTHKLKLSPPSSLQKTLKHLETARIVPKKRPQQDRHRVLWKHEQIQDELKFLSSEIQKMETERSEALRTQGIEINHDEIFNFVRGSQVSGQPNQEEKLSNPIKAKTQNHVHPKKSQLSLTEEDDSKAPISYPDKSSTSRVIRHLGLDRLLIKTPIDKILTSRTFSDTTPSLIEIKLNAMRKRKKVPINKDKVSNVVQENLSIPSIEIRSGETPISLYDRLRTLIEKRD